MEEEYIPIIIKAGSAGALETVLKESSKILTGHPEVQIIESGIGTFTEGDIVHTAKETGAILLGFDIPMTQSTENKIQ